MTEESFSVHVSKDWGTKLPTFDIFRAPALNYYAQR